MTKYIWIYAAVSALLGTACSDSEYDLQTLVPDQYHNVVNVKENTNTAVRIYDTGLDKEFEFTVLRGGSDPSVAIEAETVPMTQEELSAIDADYVLLPEKCYSLDGAIAIPKGEGADKFTVSFSADQVTTVREMSEALSAPKVYCLALKLVSEKSSVFSDKSYIIRRVDVMLPELGFAEAGEIKKQLYDAQQTVTLDFAVVRGETDETQPVKAMLSPMTQEELAKINPDYMTVPENLYTLSEKVFEIPVGAERLSLNASFTGEQISAVREAAAAQSKQACLALKIESDNAAVVEDRNILLYLMDITQPVLHFELVSGAAPHTYWPWWWDNRAYDNWYLPYPDFKTPCADCWGSGVTFRLKMPDGIQNTWTIKCRFDYDESLIAAYNESEEIMGPDLYGGLENWRKTRTDYAALPSADDMAFFDAAGNRIEEITMNPGVNEVLVTYKRNTGGFNGAGLYLCPIVASTDLFPVDNEQYVLLHDEITLPDKTLWEPYEAGDGTLAALYDGNRWGNSWQTSWFPGYCDKTYGQYFQINIKQYQPSHAIRFILWGNGDNEWHWNEGTAPREMKVFITSDAVPAPTGNHDTDRATYNALTWVEVGHIWCEAYSGRGWISPAIDLQGRTANAIRLCTYSKAGDGANYKTNSGPFEGNFNREPWNDRVQTVVNETLYNNGWEDTYGNNIVITELRMYGN